MSNWRPARSITDLRDQANSHAPHRSTASDGILGNAAHAATHSDHNPNGAGVVCAMDVTHDPANGMDVHLWARRLVAAVVAGKIPPLADLKYLISDGQICAGTNDQNQPWIWRTYNGDPHTNHVHVSVGNGPDGGSGGPYDDATDWHFELLSGGAPTPAPAPHTSEEDDMEIFHITADGPDKNSLWLRQGAKYQGIPNPGVYYELCRLLPNHGFDKPTVIDNQIVWAFMKSADASAPHA